MSNKEILEKAIDKAIDGGWEASGLGGVDTWNELSQLERMLVISLFFSKDVKNGYAILIFDHGFNKALWGQELKFFTQRDFGYGKTFGDNALPTYLYHLQQMVILPDPIKYLGDNI